MKLHAALRILANTDRIKELKRQIFDAKREGDLEYAKELQEELDKLEDQE